VIADGQVNMGFDSPDIIIPTSYAMAIKSKQQIDQVCLIVQALRL